MAATNTSWWELFCNRHFGPGYYFPVFKTHFGDAILDFKHSAQRSTAVRYAGVALLPILFAYGWHGLKLRRASENWNSLSLPQREQVFDKIVKDRGDKISKSEFFRCAVKSGALQT